MSDDITVSLGNNEPDVFVVLENETPQVQVTVSDVGLAGPPGPPGPEGPPGVDTELALEEHIYSTHPHPIYDDLDLVLLYQNAKV